APVITPQAPAITPVCHVTSQGTDYVVYKDEGKVTWTEARDRCNKEGQIMVEPPVRDEDAIALRRDVVNTCGDRSNVWLSAVGDGTLFVTQPGGRYIRNTSPLWLEGLPGSRVSTLDCMLMHGWKSALETHPGSPYWTGACSSPNWAYTLCQEPKTTSTGITGIVPGPVITPQVTNVSPEAEFFWCSHINNTACASLSIQCPQKCSQSYAATAITPGGDAPVITPQVTHATPDTTRLPRQ
ncbi:unnamed protein product, partial [Meganyctiphanes norvegica]